MIGGVSILWSLLVPWPLLAGLALMIVTAWCLMLRKSKPYLLVGWLWFIGMLLPASGLLQTG